MKRRLRRREKAIGNIDRDLLLAFRLQAVDEQSKIETLALSAEFFRIRLERLELIFEDQLRLVEQAADQRRFAVVHAAAGNKAQGIH